MAKKTKKTATVSTESLTAALDFLMHVSHEQERSDSAIAAEFCGPYVADKIEKMLSNCFAAADVVFDDELNVVSQGMKARLFVSSVNKLRSFLIKAIVHIRRDSIKSRMLTVDEIMAVAEKMGVANVVQVNIADMTKPSDADILVILQHPGTLYGYAVPDVTHYDFDADMFVDSDLYEVRFFFPNLDTIVHEFAHVINHQERTAGGMFPRWRLNDDAHDHHFWAAVDHGMGQVR